MLTINLAPGNRKAQKSGGKFDVAAAVSSVTRNIRDPWLLASAASVIMSVGVVGVLYASQSKRSTELEQRTENALRDSTRYAKVLDARQRLTAERDSVHRQLQIIRTIDENRFNWAHILDEVSRALPAYTWLTSIEQTSQPPLPPGPDSASVKDETPAARKAAAKKKADSVAAPVNIHPDLTFRVVGQTVDIQALTMFMRQLESSPFVQRVALTKSEIVIVDGKDVTQFELAAAYEVPPAGVIQTTPLTVPVR